MAIGTTAALLASAAVGAGSAALSSRAQSKAQQQAANASQQASDQAVAEQRRQYDLSRSDMQPWLNTGRNALNRLGGLYDLNGSAPQGAMTMPATAAQFPQVGQGTNYAQQLSGIGADQMYNDTRPMLAMTDGQAQTLPGEMTAQGTMQGGQTVPQSGPNPGGNFAPFYASPDYQFNYDQGQRALTARNAALGIQDSGAAQKSAIKFGAGLASQQYNNYADRLSALAGVGQTAAGQNAQLGQNYAGAVGGILQNNAQNLSSSYQNQGAINGQLYGQLGGIGAGLLSNYPWGR